MGAPTRQMSYRCVLLPDGQVAGGRFCMADELQVGYSARQKSCEPQVGARARRMSCSGRPDGVGAPSQRRDVEDDPRWVPLPGDELKRVTRWCGRSFLTTSYGGQHEVSTSSKRRVA